MVIQYVYCCYYFSSTSLRLHPCGPVFSHVQQTVHRHQGHEHPISTLAPRAMEHSQPLYIMQGIATETEPLNACLARQALKPRRPGDSFSCGPVNQMLALT